MLMSDTVYRTSTFQAGVLRSDEAQWVRMCSDAKLDLVVSHLWDLIDTGEKVNKVLSLLTAILVYVLLVIGVVAVPGGYQRYK
jgi:hypothetical protein